MPTYTVTFEMINGTSFAGDVEADSTELAARSFFPIGGAAFDYITVTSISKEGERQLARMLNPTLIVSILVMEKMQAPLDLESIPHLHLSTSVPFDEDEGM